MVDGIDEYATVNDIVVSNVNFWEVVETATTLTVQPVKSPRWLWFAITSCFVGALVAGALLVGDVQTRALILGGGVMVGVLWVIFSVLVEDNEKAGPHVHLDTQHKVIELPRISRTVTFTEIVAWQAIRRRTLDEEIAILQVQLSHPPTSLRARCVAIAGSFDQQEIVELGNRLSELSKRPLQVRIAGQPVKQLDWQPLAQRSIDAETENANGQ